MTAGPRRYDPMVALLTLGALTATVVALLRYAPIGAAVGIVTAAAGLYWLVTAERTRQAGPPVRRDR